LRRTGVRVVLFPVYGNSVILAVHARARMRGRVNDNPLRHLLSLR